MFRICYITPRLSGAGGIPVSPRTGVCSLTLAMLVLLVLAMPLEPARAKTINIVAFGTSNTLGKAVARHDAFPAQLERALKAQGIDVNVINAGRNGDTTGGMLARVNSAVPNGIHIVLVEPGFNDHRRGIKKGRVRANITAILSQLRARNIEILLFGIPKNPLHDIARAHGAVLVPPIRSGFTAGVGKTLPEYAAPDGFHLNAKAYQKVVAGVMPVVKTLIERVSTR